ncbi:unnamed protein product, partial [Protopolystoma xenopodis]
VQPSCDEARAFKCKYSFLSCETHLHHYIWSTSLTFHTGNPLLLPQLQEPSSRLFLHSQPIISSSQPSNGLRGLTALSGQAATSRVPPIARFDDPAVASSCDDSGEAVAASDAFQHKIDGGQTSAACTADWADEEPLDDYVIVNADGSVFQ